MPLLAALEGELPGAAPSKHPPGPALDTELAANQAVHARLVQAITGDTTWAPASPPIRPSRSRTVSALLPPDMPADFTPYRLRYLARQYGMETALPPLRARLRGVLAGHHPAMARLAAVDAVMEQVLAEPERRLLASVPPLLERRFRQLRDDALAQARAAAGPGADIDPETRARIAAGGPWLDTFHQEIQSVLLAELELRWSPIDGLTGALRGAAPAFSSSAAPAGAAMPP